MMRCGGAHDVCASVRVPLAPRCSCLAVHAGQDASGRVRCCGGGGKGGTGQRQRGRGQHQHQQQRRAAGPARDAPVRPRGSFQVPRDCHWASCSAAAGALARMLPPAHHARTCAHTHICVHSNACMHTHARLHTRMNARTNERTNERAHTHGARRSGAFNVALRELLGRYVVMEVRGGPGQEGHGRAGRDRGQGQDGAGREPAGMGKMRWLRFLA